MKSKAILWGIATVIFMHGCNLSKNNPTPPTQEDAPKESRFYDVHRCQKQSAYVQAKEIVDTIIIYKSARRLEAYSGDKLLISTKISLGKNADKGAKLQKGDFKTPEGTFFIIRKHCHPKHYKSLLINYPRPQDIVRAKALGLDPGGGITIHGQPKWNADGHGDSYTLQYDWTEGCIAVPNRILDKLYLAADIGTMVKIYP